jgi:soluble lytic murein transglycosylase-like protein
MKLRRTRAFHALVASSVLMVALLVFVAGCIIAAPREPAPTPLPQPQIAHAHEPMPVSSAVAPPVARRVPPRAPRVAYATLISAAAERHKVSPMLVAAIMRVESDFDPYSVSHKGARGLMQVIPETAARFGVRADELFDPERNLAAGTAYMAWLLARYDGDLDLALAGYNAGEGAVDKYRGIPPYRETQEYVRKVRREYAALVRGT